MNPDEVASLWRMLNTGGVIAVLLLNVVVFFRGLVWPSHMVERALEEQRKAHEAATKVVVRELGESLEKAVTDGVEKAIVQGILEIRKLDSKHTK